MKWAKPYAGFEGDQIVTQTSGCGVKLSFPVLPFFNMTTGKGVASTKVAAKSCLHANSTATSSLTMGFESDRFGVASIGTYHLKVTGVLDFSIDISASSGGFAQLPEAGYTVSLGFEYLNDTTSGTLYTDTYTSEMTGMTTRGTTSTTFTETWSSYLNASLSPGEVYQFVVGFTITAFVFVPVGSSSASASVNMGSAGMKATLSNVVLT